MRSIVVAAGLLLAAGCNTTMPWSSGSEQPGLGGGASLAVSPALLSFFAFTGGGRPAAQSVQVSIQGTVYVGYAYAGAAVASATLVQTSASTGTLTVLPADPTVSGTLTGTVTVRGCYDQDCTRHVAGSPAVIPVTYAVQPLTLQVAPAALAFDFVDGVSPASLATTVAVTDSASASATVNVTYPGVTGWLAVAPTSLSLPGSIGVTAAPGGLAPGTYTATLTVSSPGGSRQVPVTMTRVLPAIHYAATFVDFRAVNGQSALPAAQDVPLTTDRDIPIGYSISVSYEIGAAGWLVVPEGGSAPGPLPLSVNTASLAPGLHRATVRLNAQNGSPAAEIVVTYTVSPSRLAVSPQFVWFDIGPATDPASLSTTLAITATGAPLDWTVQSSSSAISVFPVAGTTGTTLSLSLDPSVLESLDHATYSTTFTMTANGPGVTGATTTVQVIFQPNLPCVRQAAPHVAYPDDASAIIVRGERFLAIEHPDVEFDASVATSVVVVSDTELRVTPPLGLAPGTHTVKVANGNRLGLRRSTGNVVVVPRPIHTPGLIESAGPRQRLVYDAERGCIYGASTSSNAVQRFCDTGVGWTASSLDLTGVRDVALTPDGTELYAISADTLFRISMSTFTIVGSATASVLGVTSYGPSLTAIVIPNDGRPLLLAGEYSLDLYRIDPETWSASLLLGYPGLSGGGQPTVMAASLDGDRVVAGEYGFTTPKILVYDATDGTFSVGTAAGVFAASLDRTGNRIGAWGTVYTGALAVVGSTPTWRMTVSPDGTRAYALTLPAPGSPTLHTYDISGATLVELGSGTVLAADPGMDGYPVNLLVPSLDGGTLFIDGTSGILVTPAP